MRPGTSRLTISRSEQNRTVSARNYRYIRILHPEVVTAQRLTSSSGGKPPLNPGIRLLPCSEVKSVTRPEKNTLETILVVEDQPVVLEAVREILERAGFCVLTAGCGAQAIRAESITEGTIHLLLSDVKMPDMSGPVVAQLLKKRRPEMRVMLMSGYSDGEMLPLNHGWHFMQKPFLPAALVERVHEVLHSPEHRQGDHVFDKHIEPKASESAA